MKEILAIVSILVISSVSVMFRSTAHAQQFFKLDSPQATQTAQVEEIPTRNEKPLKQAENAPESKPAETPVAEPAPTPANCTADQWVRADNGQCIDKPTQAAAPVAQAPAAPVAQAASVGNCGDNMYKQYIYQHESGCQTDRWNSSGCYGIGQACPASKIAHCGTDFACQDAWFSNYAEQRYGGWAGAYNFWLNNHWW